MLRFVDLSTEEKRKANYLEGFKWSTDISRQTRIVGSAGEETYTGKERMVPPPPPPPNDLGELYPTHTDWETVFATTLKFSETASGFTPTLQEQPVELFNAFLAKIYACPWIYTLQSNWEDVGIETQSFDPLLDWLDAVFKPVYPGDWNAYIEKVLGLIDLATRSQSVVQRSSSFSGQSIVNQSGNMDWSIAYSYILLSYKEDKGTVIINQRVYTAYVYMRLNKGSARNNAQNILKLDFQAGEDWVNNGMAADSKVFGEKCQNLIKARHHRLKK